MRNKHEHQYHYFYKITNKINGHYYYGIHSTSNLNDGYMGSGIVLHKAYEKYGITNFCKEIIRFFDTREEASQYEADVVNEETAKSTNCYNMITGGDRVLPFIDMVPVRDVQNGMNVYVYRDVYYNSNNGRYKTYTSGTVRVREKMPDGSLSNEFLVSTGEYHKNKNKYVTFGHGKRIVKDKDGNSYVVSYDDERLKNGEFTLYWSGRKLSQEHVNHIRETFKKINHQQGERNSNYGKRWVNKDGVAKSVKSEDLESYMAEGWEIGRVHKTKKERPIPRYKLIDSEKAYNLHNSGYSWREVAIALGCTEPVIWEWLRWERYGKK